MKVESGRPRKACEACGSDFTRHPRDSDSQWESRAYCSISCRNKSTMPVPIHLRFWKHVERRGATDCWEWTGNKDGRGYGSLSGGSGSSPVKAHRLSYELANGPIPTGLVVRHSCDNPICVNPAHLEAGTQKENIHDMVVRGRANPKSQLNLKPGAKNIHGAGPLSNGEILNGTRSQ